MRKQSRFDLEEGEVERVKQEETQLIAALEYALQHARDAAINRVSQDERGVFESNENDHVLIVSSTFNCSVSVRQNHYVMAMNFGLVKFYSEMTRMLFSRLNIVSESQYKAGFKPPEPISFSETVKVAEILMEAFWNGRLPNSRRLPVLNLTGATLSLFERFLAYGLLFVTSHELAHVILEISPQHQHYRKAGEDLVKNFLAQAPQLDPVFKQHTVQNWGLEFAADVLGLELGIAAEQIPTLKWIQMYASEWFFVMCDMLWRYYSMTRGSIQLDTHPAPFMRLDVLRNHVNASKRERDMTEALGRMAQEILKELAVKNEPAK